VSDIEHTPPRWAEALLERLIPVCERDSIVGDLREEFIESVLPHRGWIHARFWYVRQVASFVPWFSREGLPMGKVLLLVSVFTLAGACWLALMEMLLRHPGYAERIGVALGIALICAATILVRMLHVGFRGERWLWVGAAMLIVFGAQAFFRNAHALHFEGFVFVLSLLLVLQGVLMLMTLGRATGRPAQRPNSAHFQA
jgi:hypothetical protein